MGLRRAVRSALGTWGGAAAPAPGRPEPPPRRSMLGVPAPAVGDAAAGGVVVFLTSSCMACREIWAALAAGAAADLPGRPPVTVVTPDPSLEDRRQVEALTPPGIVALMRTDTWTAFGVHGSPWVTVVHDGVIAAEGPAGCWADVAALAVPG